MKKLIIGGLAALTFGLGVAPVAGADANDRAFIAATDRVIRGVGPWAGPDGWIGYPKVPAQLRINTAHGVCGLLDVGALSANQYIVDTLDDCLICGLFRDSIQFCSDLVDLVIGVRDDGGGGHLLALAGERFVGVIAEHLAEVRDGGGKLWNGRQGYGVA